MGNGESNLRKKLEGRPVVVIVGGGFAGVQTALALDKTFNVVLIDRKNYFFLNFGSLRATVDSNFLERIIIPYDNLLSNGVVIQAEVSEIRKDGVCLHGRDEPVSFDYLVICTGTSYAFPAKVGNPFAKDLPSLYKDAEKAVEEAKHIVIIGGGPVGVELVGEIAYKHPDKIITLIHSKTNLIPGPLSLRFKEDILKRIQAIKNVTIILDEEVIITEDLKEKFANRYIKEAHNLETKKGVKMESDLTFFCGGSEVNNGSFQAKFAEQMDEHGRLKVNRFLQVEGCQNIFACGDCANVPEPKMGYTARVQAAHLAKNLILIDMQKIPKEYVPSHPAMMVPLGPELGAAQLPNGMLVGNTLTSIIKGKNLFVPSIWEFLKQKVPSSWDEERFAADVDADDVAWLAKVMKIPEEDAQKLKEGLKPVQHVIHTDAT